MKIDVGMYRAEDLMEIIKILKEFPAYASHMDVKMRNSQLEGRVFRVEGEPVFVPSFTRPRSID